MDFLLTGTGNPEFAWPYNYVYAGFYASGDSGAYNNYGSYYFQFNGLRPIHDNFFYRNFVYDADNLSTNGWLQTGISNGWGYSTGGGGDGDQTQYFFGTITITNDPEYYFNLGNFLTNSTASVPASQLSLANTTWILPPKAVPLPFWVPSSYPGNPIPTNTVNYYGLPLTSEEFAYVTTGSLLDATYYPGDATPTSGTGVIYSDTVAPILVTTNYYFARVNMDPMPEMSGYSTASVTPLFIQPIGTSLQIAGYAQMCLQNGYTNVYAYLGQYFDKAYVLDAEGNTTSNSAGILSPAGSFFATEPGPVGLVTMPDIDTGERGTCTVYTVSLQLDANHDGVMDLAYGGTDSTSLTKPMQFWVNNNFDRSLFSSDDETNIDDDALPGDPAACCPFSPKTLTPDCNYLDITGHRVIPCARDLQDFARLWVCGITSNLLAALPAGSSVTLNWGDVASPNTNNPTIDLFQAADTDGGMGYLTNSAIASSQTNASQCAYVARIGPGTSVNLAGSQFSNDWAGSHFIWCGVAPGAGQLTLTIEDDHSNVLAQTSASIQIQDIKYMYERWTVGDAITNPPTSTARIAEDDLANTNLPGFQFSAPVTTNTPYILFAHGWNMTMYDKDRFAETAFKRLYWQGYEGRFGSFQWPTGNGFGGTAWDLLENSRNFDTSEYQSWLSAVGLTNLLTGLNAEYPGNVYLIAHSMGNVVAGEALRLANSQLVKTYIAMEGAIAAHAYDATTASRSLVFLGDNRDQGEPDGFANYYTSSSPCYFNGAIGAGTYINFYNTNDYALSKWTIDQDFKPDHGLTSYPGYHYSSSSGFYIIYGPATNQTIYLNFPTNTYQIFAYGEQARSFALGAQANVDGDFGGLQIDLHSVWPPDSLPGLNYGSHFWHSAEFRGDYSPQMNFWKAILGPNGLNLQ